MPRGPQNRGDPGTQGTPEPVGTPEPAGGTRGCCWRGGRDRSPPVYSGTIARSRSPQNLSPLSLNAEPPFAVQWLWRQYPPLPQK